MKHGLKTFITASIFASCISATAQINSFSKDDLVSDFRLAMNILKKQHPNPYKFIDSVSYDRQVDSLLKKMDQQNNLFACTQFSPVGLLRDVHTNIVYSEEAA